MCTGPWPSAKQAWARAPFVFLGTVEVADPDRPANETIFQNQAVRIRVVEAFKGVRSGQLIELHEGGNDCAAKFRTGQRAVFYLQKDQQGELYVPSCTRAIGNAALLGDDLLFLHGLPKSAVGTRLSGEVQLYEDSPQEAFKRVGGVPNVHVKISDSNSSTLETTTNAEGAYEVYNLRPGKYTVSIDAPKGLRSVDPIAVELEKDGAASLDFVLRADTRLSGHLLDANGNPKQGVCIDLEPQEGRGENGARFFDCSKGDGAFQMELMPPGKYWLIAHDVVKSSQFESTSTLYYPGVRDRNNAKLISIEAGHYLENLDIKSLANEKRYQITGRMQFADGVPAGYLASVAFRSPEHGYTETTSVAPDGSFGLTVIPGMEGQVDGRITVMTSTLALCPQFEVGPQIRGIFRFMDATPIPISGDSDRDGFMLVLPSPSCKAWPPHRN